MSAAHGEQVRVFEEHGQQTGRSMEWWGMMFFIGSEALIFANFIAAFLYLKIRSGEHWHMEQVVLPAIFTVLLLLSSWTMHIAGTGIRKGDQKRLIIGLAGTILLGAIFLGGQGFEYYTLIEEGFTIGKNIQGSAFYTLTGFHGLHVTIGVIFLVICLIRGSLGHFSAKKHFAVEAAEMYWHFVDIVWVFVFSLIYLLPIIA